MCIRDRLDVEDAIQEQECSEDRIECRQRVRIGSWQEDRRARASLHPPPLLSRDEEDEEARSDWVAWIRRNASIGGTVAGVALPTRAGGLRPATWPAGTEGGPKLMVQRLPPLRRYLGGI